MPEYLKVIMYSTKDISQSELQPYKYQGLQIKLDEHIQV